MRIFDLDYVDPEGDGTYVITLKDRVTGDLVSIPADDPDGEVLIIGPRQEHVPIKIGQQNFTRRY